LRRARLLFCLMLEERSSMPLSRGARCVDRIAQEIADETQLSLDPERPPLSKEEILTMLARPREGHDDRVWPSFEAKIDVAVLQAGQVLLDRRAHSTRLPGGPEPTPDEDLIDAFVELVVDDIVRLSVQSPTLMVWLALALKELGVPA
jgi:hypothetical protein